MIIYFLIPSFEPEEGTRAQGPQMPLLAGLLKGSRRASDKEWETKPITVRSDSPVWVMPAAKAGLNAGTDSSQGLGQVFHPTFQVIIEPCLLPRRVNNRQAPWEPLLGKTQQPQNIICRGNVRKGIIYFQDLAGLRGNSGNDKLCRVLLRLQQET